MLLAVTVALATLMLAAAPAFAQPVTEIDGFRFSPGDCGNLEGTTLTREQAAALLEEAGLDPEDLPDAGNICLLAQPDGQDGDGDGDGVDDGVRDRDRFFNDLFDEPFIVQETEQEAESGDIDQDFDVSQTGDNSNQTVGIQGVANTGNVQNAIDVVDAGNFGDFGDDDVFVDDNDGEVICFDEDGDGDNDGGDSNSNGISDDLECVVVDDGIFGDDFFDDDFFDGDFDNDFGDFEFEEVGADIDISPTNTVDSSQQVNQAAAASGDDNDLVWVWDPTLGWVLVPAA